MNDRSDRTKTSGPRIISFINFKGGVGKTSVAVNVAAVMASESVGKRVLLIDADAQANATIWCVGQAKWREGLAKKVTHTIYQIFKDADSRNRNFRFQDSVITDGLLNGHAPNLHLLSSTYKMMEAEDLVWNINPNNRTTLLRNSLIQYVTDYDVVIFDCPPNTYCVTQNAIRMSHNLFVVAIPDFLSVIGFDELVQRLRFLWHKVALSGPVPVVGVIANSHNPRFGELKTGIGQLRQLVNELSQRGWISSDCELLKPPISRSISCSNAARRGLPVGAVKTPGGIKLSYEFQELTDTIMKKIKV